MNNFFQELLKPHAADQALFGFQSLIYRLKRTKNTFSIQIYAFSKKGRQMGRMHKCISFCQKNLCNQKTTKIKF
jgi:hypothetical protein